MGKLRHVGVLWLFLLLVIATSGLVGCATTDEAVSERPWSTPQSWETGIPSGLIDRQR